MFSKRRPLLASERRPSGLSAGAADRSGTRTMRGAPASASRLFAKRGLMAMAEGSSGSTAGSKPRTSGESQARSVARMLRRGCPACAGRSTITSSTSAGTRVTDGPTVAANSSASSSRKKLSATTAASIPPSRLRAKRERPDCMLSPTPTAPTIVAATIPHAAARAATGRPHCQASLRAKPPRVRRAGGLCGTLIATHRRPTA